MSHERTGKPFLILEATTPEALEDLVAAKLAEGYMVPQGCCVQVRPLGPPNWIDQGWRQSWIYSFSLVDFGRIPWDRPKVD